jgi:hypothetical protein
MTNSVISLLIIIGLIVILLTGIISAIASKDKKLQHSGSFASMAAFHDMQSGEKQKAVEIVIEQQAGKKWEEEESGDGNKGK